MIDYISLTGGRVLKKTYSNKILFYSLLFVFIFSNVICYGALTKGRIESEEKGYFIYIIWDAFRYDYYEWANSGQNPGTPALNELIENGVLFTDASTGIPSITNPMQAVLVTGAYPRTTGNIYRYFDKEDQIVKQTRRDNSAETLAEAASKQGLKVASVQQFMVQDRGTSYDDPSHLYIQPSGSFQKRVDESIKILKGQPVVTQGDTEVVFEGIPDIMFIYSDDLDTVGHNEKPSYGYYDSIPADSEEERIERCVEVLIQMDSELARLIDTLKEIGIYEKTSFVIAADHGMTPYSGTSSLNDLIEILENCLEALGHRVNNDTVVFLAKDQVANEANKIVIVSVGLQAQIYLNWDFTQEEYDFIVNELKSSLYSEFIGGVLTFDELQARGSHPKTGDMLVWPKPPHHFKSSTSNYNARGGHDTIDESSQHVFLLMSGAGFKKGTTINKKVYNWDIVPTISKVLKIEPPENADGKVVIEAIQ